MKLLTSTLASYVLAADDYWVNNYDQSARVPCGQIDSLADVTHVSWFKTPFTADNKLGPTQEVAEQIRENGKITQGESKIDGYSINDDGSLSIQKADGDQFSPDDVGLYKCSVNKGTVPADYVYKFKVNYLLDKDNLTPTVRHKKFGPKGGMEYPEGIHYDIAECESREAGPDAAILRWRALDESGTEISDSSVFSACKGGDDSNFCGKTNDYFMDKKDRRALQTTTLPLAFTADGFGGISSDFDKAYFECVGNYKEARNGVLEDLFKSTRWPADDKFVRVLHPVKNVEILVNGASVQAGVLDTTYGKPDLSCASDGYDNESDNELVPSRNDAGANIEFGCKARNGQNEGNWVEKSFIFTQASLSDPTATAKHGGLVVEVTADSSPANAKKGSVVYKCDTLPKKQTKGTKENRDMYEYLEANCVKATPAEDGITHVIKPDDNRKPFTVAVATLEVADSEGNTETLYNYVDLSANPRNGPLAQDEPFPIQAWFENMPFGEPDNQVEAYYYDETQQKLIPIDGEVIDEREDGRFHAIVDPQPADGGKYVFCYDFSDSIDENKYTGNTYDEVKNDLHRDHSDFCRFYENSFLDTGNLMGLLFIPILLLLALIIYCVWKHCCGKEDDKNDEEEDTEKANPEVKQIAGGPEQGPEVQAVERTHSHRLNSDARCDFTNDESPTADETTPFVQQASA